MKINTTTVLSAALGVLIAGAALYFAGDLPGIKEARRGFDGRSQ